MNKFLALLLFAVTAGAQAPLTLAEAVELALASHPSIAAGRSGVRVAETRIQQARSGFLPKLNYLESWQRSDNPVFVFGSLLTQRRFAEANFQIGALNRPNVLTNFQSQLVLEQPLYDAGSTRHAIRSAELGRDLANEEQRRTSQDVIANVVRAYFGAALSAEFLRVTEQAVRSAEADLARAEALRNAGMITDADVLSIQVHLAAMREQQIRRRSDLDVARAALNEALGMPFDSRYTLTTGLALAQPALPTLEEAEKESLLSRTEVRQSQLTTALAQTQVASARAALLPQVSFRAVFEADRQRLVTRGSANWFAGVALRWNLFDGNASRARVSEARYMIERAQALEQGTSAGVRLQVRRAHADLEAARERVAVAEVAVSQAGESLRITKNRYEKGLSTVTDLLRNETAVLEASSRQLAALNDRRLAGVALELATGTLGPDSDVLK